MKSYHGMTYSTLTQSKTQSYLSFKNDITHIPIYRSSFRALIP